MAETCSSKASSSAPLLSATTDTEMCLRYIESPSEEVVQGIVKACAGHQPLWLATVVSTWGSSPRPPGSMMLWSAEYGLTGSVSGGCVEEELIVRFREHAFAEEQPTLIVYGEDEDEARKLRLPCGGKLCLLIEALHHNPHNKTDSDLWQQLANNLQQRQGCLRTIDLKNGEWSLDNSAPRALQQTPEHIAVYLGPAHKLLIVGANQIASYLALFAQALNFSVSVCDPGEPGAHNFPQQGLRFLQCYPDGLINQEFNDSASAVVAVSHDPRLDDMALLEALPGQAFYVGAMGSLRTSDARRERLRELGLSETDLQKLKAPIGVDIGSKSPAEIAISIAADLIHASKTSAQRAQSA